MSRRLLPTPLIITLTMLAATAIAVVAAAAEGGWTRDGALAAARLTARFSFPVFVLAWSASALARLWPGGWRTILLRRRRAIGLSFAGAHAVHLVALLVAILVFGAPASPVGVLDDGAGYVLLAAMALTSNDSAVRALGPARWRLLHTVGSYAIAAIFAFSYWGRLETHPELAIPTLSLLALAAALRLAAWIKARAVRPAIF